MDHGWPASWPRGSGVKTTRVSWLSQLSVRALERRRVMLSLVLYVNKYHSSPLAEYLVTETCGVSHLSTGTRWRGVEYAIDCALPHGLAHKQAVGGSTERSKRYSNGLTISGVGEGEGGSLLYGSPTFAVNMGLLYVVFVYTKAQCVSGVLRITPRCYDGGTAAGEGERTQKYGDFKVQWYWCPLRPGPSSEDQPCWDQRTGPGQGSRP